MSAEPALSVGEVERLLLHTCSERPRSLTDPAPASQEKSCIQSKCDEEPILMSATITDFNDDPFFFSGYQSDEEDISASEAASEPDDMSLSPSSSSSTLDDASAGSKHNEDLDVGETLELYSPSEANFPEMLAEDCNFVEQQCNKAQAIMVVSAGRPKMVQVAKNDIASTPLLRRPGSSASNHTFGRSASRLSLASLKAHNRGRSTSSTTSENSIPETHVSSGSLELPSTPTLDSGLRTPSSTHSPLTPATPESTFFEPIVSPTLVSTALNDTCSPTPTVRAARSSSFRMRLPHMKRNSSFTQSIYSEERLNAPLPSPPSSKLRMVARGANERSPILELPPFPGESYFHDSKTPRSPALRNDPLNPVQARQSNSKRLMRVGSAFSLNKR